MDERLTHLDDSGRARMVDVGDKPVHRARGDGARPVRMAPATLARAMSGDTPKGDVRAIAEIAGVMAGKRTSELIPLCHPLSLSEPHSRSAPDAGKHDLVVTARAATTAQTGVEMEALTAVSVACLHRSTTC